MPIPGVEFAIMDFLEDDAPERLKAILGGPADAVMSDMAANATGHRQTDHLRIVALAELAAEFACEVLAPGGFFVAKVLQGGTERPASGAPETRFRRRQARQARRKPRGFGRALRAGDGLPGRARFRTSAG